MKKSVTYQSRFSFVEFVVNVRKSISMSMMRFAVMLSVFFSVFLEERISPMQSLRVLHLIVACCFAVMPIGLPMVLRLLALAWFGLTVVQVRQEIEDD